MDGRKDKTYRCEKLNRNYKTTVNLIILLNTIDLDICQALFLVNIKYIYKDIYVLCGVCVRVYTHKK